MEYLLCITYVSSILFLPSEPCPSFNIIGRKSLFGTVPEVSSVRPLPTPSQEPSLNLTEAIVVVAGRYWWGQSQKDMLLGITFDNLSTKLFKNEFCMHQYIKDTFKTSVLFSTWQIN